MSRSYTRMSTPMVNAEIAENIVKNTIFKNWKQIQQQCRQKDVDNSGTINVVDLKGSFFLFVSFVKDLREMNEPHREIDMSKECLSTSS